MKSNKQLLTAFILVAVYLGLGGVYLLWGLSNGWVTLSLLQQIVLSLHFVLLLIAFVFHVLAYSKHHAWALITAGVLYSVATLCFLYSVLVMGYVIVVVFLGVKRIREQWIYKIT
ncbi:MAG: hypothetical protein ACRDBX_07190 [Erysipelotrichaceae bacterium]